jgi:hypothetical protein
MSDNGYIDDGFQLERASRRSVIAANQYRDDLREVELERDILLLGLKQLKRKYAGNPELKDDIESIIRVSKINITT